MTVAVIIFIVVINTHGAINLHENAEMSLFIDNKRDIYWDAERGNLGYITYGMNGLYYSTMLVGAVLLLTLIISQSLV